MDSRDNNNNNPPSSHQQLIHPSVMNRYQYTNAAPTSTSQPIHSLLPFASQSLDSHGFGNGSSQPIRFANDQSQIQNQNLNQKKKRGRPRKYAPDGNIALGLAPTSPVPSAVGNSNGDGGGGEGGEGNGNGADTPAKRNRGRPPGKKQVDKLQGVTQGTGFIPHIIEISQGEDIVAKMTAFSEQASRLLSILSATGAVTNATLCETSGSSRGVTYEGEFDIVSMAGSFITGNGSANTSGSLSVTLGGLDGQIFGGFVVGSLFAASDVLVVVGSFIVDDKKPNQSNNNNARGPNPEPVSAAPAANNMLNGSNSHGPSSESSEDSGSPFVPRDNSNNNNNGIHGNSLTPQQQQHQRLQQQQMYGFWPNFSANPNHGHGQ